ncbi:hypothetical protein [Ralstonia solanacearum]|uniref:Uncharacterized protein n=1 Tax=Ralstonia solanacearum TaxID=305 RepID=A0AAE3NNA8_RALSL|nr:hypothetical protein [Ralstonia solanacearum]MBB6583389.1 hypothetical protein [Ralstonia solanacearum]MDB0523506.1 hypothetical protein [Ralstonia solanacearum]
MAITKALVLSGRLDGSARANEVLDGYSGRKEVNGRDVEIYLGASADEAGNVYWLGTPQIYVDERQAGESHSTVEAIQIGEAVANSATNDQRD